MIFYHITPTANIPFVLEQGLLPSVGDRSLEANEFTPFVYAFFDKNMLDDAMGGWLDGCFDDDIELSVITFEADKGFNIISFEAQFEEVIHPSSFLSIASLV